MSRSGEYRKENKTGGMKNVTTALEMLAAKMSLQLLKRHRSMIRYKFCYHTSTSKSVTSWIPSGNKNRKVPRKKRLCAKTWY
jgi:hypothetical protein